jgi:hypothetical protein
MECETKEEDGLPIAVAIGLRELNKHMMSVLAEADARSHNPVDGNHIIADQGMRLIAAKVLEESGLLRSTGEYRYAITDEGIRLYKEKA